MRKQEIYVTVDNVVFSAEGGEEFILLIQRKYDPFKLKWALPGGFLEEAEDLAEGAARELEEETGIQVTTLKQVGIFGNPGRDPRGRTISIVFAARLSSRKKLQAGDDAGNARWFKLNKLPSLAFDHLEIIHAAKLVV